MDPIPEAPAQLPAAPFPAPPPFWKHFTAENVERAAALTIDTERDHQAFPSELMYCRPPRPPSTTADSYNTFGISQSLNPAPVAPPDDILLFDAKSPDINPAKLLSRITKSLLLNFLELTTILGNNPVQYEEKMSDINRLMLNAHFVINTYRPHQAREGVKEMLEERLQYGRAEIQRCEEMKIKVEDFLRSIGNLPSEGDSALERQLKHGSSQTEAKEDGLTDDNMLWKLIHNLEDQ